jgi:hypothetical protein
MQVSVIGFVICAGILVAGYYLRSALVIGLMASLAFGSTAIVTLSSLGGSSPLIYTAFAALMVGCVALERRLWQNLGTVFGQIRASWVVCSLMIYAVVGALIFPRLFAGQTSVFVASRTRRGVFEVPLEPVSGNISQTGYFVLGGMTFLALCVLLISADRMAAVRRAFFAWCILHTSMGLIDLMGKLAGAGDVLWPVRTASYEMLTETDQAGFARIAGAYSEASAFGGVSLACLAFTFTYWHKTKSRLALALALILLFLLLLSTSSTAYVGLMILSFPVSLSVARSLLAGRLGSKETLLLTLFTLCLLTILAISVVNPAFFDPFIHLFETAVINKSSSTSGQERAYWNYKSFQSFIDTGGLGIGFGSSRASSWIIAVLSQLGLVGAIMLATLLAMILRGLGRLHSRVDPETDAIVSSVRATALAGIVSGSIASGSADPGMIFFISLAVISAARARAKRSRTSNPFAVQARPTRAIGATSAASP